MAVNKITIRYRIREYDPAQRILIVDFDDGGWADIRLQEPLPTTIEELDELIAERTDHVEHIEARARPFDDSLVSKLVGKTRTAPRCSSEAKLRKEIARLKLNAEEPAPAPLAAVDDQERAWIAGIVREVVTAMKQEGAL